MPETCEAGKLECDESVSTNQVENVEDSMAEDMQFQLLQAGQSIRSNEERPKHAAFKAAHRRKKAVQVSSDAEIEESETEPAEDNATDDSTSTLVTPISGMSSRKVRAIATERKLDAQHKAAEEMLTTRLAKQQAANKARAELRSKQSEQDLQQAQMPQVVQMPYGYASGVQMLPSMSVPPSVSSTGSQQMPTVFAMPMQQGDQQTMPQVQQTMPQVMQTISLQDGTQAFIPQMMPQQNPSDLSQAPPIANYEIFSDRHSHGRQGRMYSQQYRNEAQEGMRKHALKKRAFQKLQASKRMERQNNKRKNAAKSNQVDQMAAPMQYMPVPMEVPASLAQTSEEGEEVTEPTEEDTPEEESELDAGDEEEMLVAQDPEGNRTNERQKGNWRHMDSEEVLEEQAEFRAAAQAARLAAHGLAPPPTAAPAVYNEETGEYEVVGEEEQYDLTPEQRAREEEHELTEKHQEQLREVRAEGRKNLYDYQRKAQGSRTYAVNQAGVPLQPEVPMQPEGPPQPYYAVPPLALVSEKENLVPAKDLKGTKAKVVKPLKAKASVKENVVPAKDLKLSKAQVVRPLKAKASEKENLVHAKEVSKAKVVKPLKAKASEKENLVPKEVKPHTAKASEKDNLVHVKPVKAKQVKPLKPAAPAGSWRARRDEEVQQRLKEQNSQRIEAGKARVDELEKRRSEHNAKLEKDKASTLRPTAKETQNLIMSPAMLRHQQMQEQVDEMKATREKRAKARMDALMEARQSAASRSSAVATKNAKEEPVNKFEVMTAAELRSKKMHDAIDDQAKAREKAAKNKADIRLKKMNGPHAAK